VHDPAVFTERYVALSTVRRWVRPHDQGPILDGTDITTLPASVHAAEIIVDDQRSGRPGEVAADDLQAMRGSQRGESGNDAVEIGQRKRGRQRQGWGC